jgi:hypothetical protein
MNIAKDTAKRMLQNINQELQELAAQQQSMNGNVGGQQSYRCGGLVRRKFDWGGDTTENDPYKQETATQKLKNPNDDLTIYKQAPIKKVALPIDNPNFGWDAFNSNGPSYDPKPINRTGNPWMPFKAPTLYDGSLMNNQLVDASKQAKLGMIKPPEGPGFGDKVMNNLPGIFNLAAGLFSPKAQKLNPNQFQNPYAAQALAMMPSQYRIDPQLAEARNAQANAYRNINNQANSRGERMANYGSAMNQYNSQVGNLYAEKNNQENQYAREKAGMLNEQGMQRANINLNVQNMNDQNRAAAYQNRMGYLGAAASDFQKSMLVNKQMANQQAAQMAYMKALFNRNPYMAAWLGFDQKNPLGLLNAQ